MFLDKIQRLIYLYGMYVYATNNLSLFTCLNIDSSYIVLHFLKSIRHTSGSLNLRLT